MVVLVLVATQDCIALQDDVMRSKVDDFNKAPQ